MTLTELEPVLLSIEGQMSLCVYGSGLRRTFAVWFWKHNRDYRGSGHTLAEAISNAIASSEMKKKCTRCCQTKPYSQFPACPDKCDGKASQCLECDRKRKEKWYPRKARRGAHAAQGQREAGQNPHGS